MDLLDDPEICRRVSAADRSLLRQALLEGIATRTAPNGSARVLHGSPHEFHILVMGGDAVFIDFETVELGPLEWDLAHLGDEVATLYPADPDEVLLRRCRLAISAATSTWCWKGSDRGADMRLHAVQHLEIVRRALA